MYFNRDAFEDYLEITVDKDSSNLPADEYIATGSCTYIVGTALTSVDFQIQFKVGFLVYQVLPSLALSTFGLSNFSDMMLEDSNDHQKYIQGHR